MPDVVNVIKDAHITQWTRAILTPCASKLEVDSSEFPGVDAKGRLSLKDEDVLSSTVFEKTKDDDKGGLSVEDSF